jgi:hypothetical protein
LALSQLGSPASGWRDAARLAKNSYLRIAMADRCMGIVDEGSLLVTADRRSC